MASINTTFTYISQGKRVLDSEGNTLISDTYYENSMLLDDNKRLQQRIKSMQETINILIDRNAKLKLEKQMHEWSKDTNSDMSVANLVENYLTEIEKLKAKLVESEEMCQQLRKLNSTGTSPRVNKTIYEGRKWNMQRKFQYSIKYFRRSQRYHRYS